MLQQIGRIGRLLCVMLVLAAAAPAVFAQPDTLYLSVSAMHGTLYPPGRWMPLRVEVRNTGSQPFSGHVAMPVRGVDGKAVEFQLPVSVPPQSRVRYVAYAYFPAEVSQTEEERRKSLTPPVTVAELRDASGARRAQEPLLAIVLNEGDYGDRIPAITLAVHGDAADTIEAFDISTFANVVKQARRYNSTGWSQEAESFPRHPAAVEAAQVVALTQVDPEAFDLAQREAMLEHVRRGGVLVVSAPDVSATRQSWLVDYLPVRLIGSRQMDRVQGEDGVELPFIGWVPLTEALAGDGGDDVVVLRDAHYVHAAYRNVGLGRIVFTSFPMASLHESDENAIALWRRLLNPPYTPRSFEQTQLASETQSGETARDLILSRMIGRQVPPWGMAAGIAGIYVLSVLGAQVMLRGASRPRAFAATVVVAGVLTVGLVSAAMLRQQEQTPMSARIAVVDLAEEGGGLAREAVAFVGAESDSFTLRATGPDVSLRPMDTFTPNDQPVVHLYPFSAPRAGVRMDSYQRVWQARSGVNPDWRLTATAQFDEQGVQLHVNNATGATLEAARLHWGTAHMPLSGTVSAGESQVRAQRRETGAMLVSGEDTLRADVLDALQPTNAWIGALDEDASPPLLVGFVDGTAVPALIQPVESDGLEVRSQAVVRTPVRILPTPVGQRVQVPAPLMKPVLTRLAGLPYDANRQEWLPATSTGEWLVGFRPPEGIGRLRPIRIVIDANINAPRHVVIVRRQQVNNGEPQPNLSGAVAAHWNQPVGPQNATIEINAEDADSSGTVWLMVDVKRDAPPGPGELPSMWQFQWLRITYDAEVIGG